MSYIDIHCHPSMMIYLAGGDISTGALTPTPLGWLFNSRMKVSLPKLKSGNVNAIVSVYYLPEKGLIKDTDETGWIPLLERLGGFLFPPGFIAELLILYTKFESRSNPDRPFEQICWIIKQAEKKFSKAKAPDGTKPVIAYNFNQFEELSKDANNLIFLHSIESANCLGPKDKVNLSELKSRVTKLFNLGVCQFTIGHFYENILVSSSGGIPRDIANIIGYKLKDTNTYINGYNENQNIAEEIINHMLEIGIIIDLVHCHPGAKKLIYKLNNARGAKKRPLVFSHTGIKEITFGNNPIDENYEYYLPDKEDIIQIKECEGVFGIICMKYWLKNDNSNNNVIDDILDTIEFVRSQTGSYDNISIGSDFDGLTHVPNDLSGSHRLYDIINALKSKGVSDPDIQKISFDNYKRVLKKGWGSYQNV